MSTRPIGAVDTDLESSLEGISITKATVDIGVDIGDP